MNTIEITDEELRELIFIVNAEIGAQTSLVLNYKFLCRNKSDKIITDKNHKIKILESINEKITEKFEEKFNKK